MTMRSTEMTRCEIEMLPPDVIVNGRLKPCKEKGGGGPSACLQAAVGLGYNAPRVSQLQGRIVVPAVLQSEEQCMHLMRRFQVLVVAVIILIGGSVTFAADIYQVDTAHTNVGFTVRHLVINKVRGKFNVFSGTITYDENDITKSSLNGTIQVSSIDTDHPKRDQHLRSPDFFDAENHKEITFVSTQVEKEGEGYVLVGNLTLRGTSKQIRVPFEMTGKIIDPQKQIVIGFEAALRINRQDFGVSYSKTMDNGGLVVGNTVTIELVGEAIKQAG
jgi:polyisoprenoid-binding protein YceI